MKMSLPPQTHTMKLARIEPLNVVRRNREYFLVTATRRDFDSDDVHDVECVNLHSGHIEAIPSDIDVEVMQSNLTVSDDIRIPQDRPFDPTQAILNYDETEEIRAGRKIAAIKLFRDRNPGMGLKDAKDAIDYWAARDVQRRV